MRTHVAKMNPDNRPGVIFWSACDTIGYTSLTPDGKMNALLCDGVSPETVRRFAIDLLILCDAHEKSQMGGSDELPGWSNLGE